MSGDPVVAAVGAYVPRLAFPTDAYEAAWDASGPAGIERTAVPDADEDSLTLAAEAGRRALDAGAVDRSAVDRLLFATTTPPSEEDETPARLASLLGVPERVAARQYGGSTRAGVAALADAATSGDRPTSGVTLVVAADCPAGAPESDAEAAAGAGAGAVLVVEDGETNGASDLAVTGVGERTEAYPGTRYRRRGSVETESVGVAAYEREAYRTCVVGAVGSLDDETTRDAETTRHPDAVALTAPNGRLPYRVAGDAPGLTTEAIAAGTTVNDVGDAGVAGPFLGLAEALTDGAGAIVLVGYGGGAGATAVRLDADSERDDADGAADAAPVPVDATLVPVRDLSYAEYARRRGHVTGEAPAGGGADVSVPSWRRTLPQRHGLVTGRCRSCATLAFPPEGACTACGSLDAFEPVRLSGRGTVEAVTTVGGAGVPPEFSVTARQSGEFGVVVVAFDGPNGAASVSAPAAVVPDAASPEVGDRVRAVPRRIYEREGVVRYGFKLLPEAATRDDRSSP